jgi:hypothetical protein
MLLRASPPFPFLLSLFILKKKKNLMGIWRLRGAHSKFKLLTKLFWNILSAKLKGFDFKFHVFFESIFVNEVNLKPPQFDGSPSMKIHEIHPWHTIYNIISSMMFGLFTNLFFALKTILFHGWTCINIIYGFSMGGWMKVHPLI